MPHSKFGFIDFTPLIISFSAITLTDINTLLSTVSIGMSIVYTIYKYKKDKE